MGVADNKSYKNQYHFKEFSAKTKLDDFPSLFEDNPQINSTIKKNPDRANVEIEKDELVLKPDMSALFKARGKKHYNGGIDVNLEPDSFIFSDDKSLAITPNERKKFEFKQGGKVKMTPAEVLKKNVDTEHYNRLVSNLQDPKSDDLVKRSSALMLEKYAEKIGQVAYLQEMKKDFPSGVPSFAENTAPVFSSDVKDKIMENKQYGKFGGRIFAVGGTTTENTTMPPYKDITTPFQFNNKWYVRKNNQMVEVPKPAPQAGMDSYFLNPASRYNGSDISDPATLPIIPPSGNPYRNKNSGVDPLTPPSGVPPITTPPVDVPYQVKPLGIIPRKPFDTPLPPVSNPTVPQIAGGDGTIRADWEFTPYQKESQLYNLDKALDVKRYLPYRSRYNASYIDPALVNPEQAVGDLQTAANSNIQSSNSLNPILRNAQNSDIYGQLLDKIPSVRSAYDNQNVGIINQTRQYNNQIKNNETLTNNQNDQTYYQQEVTGRANYDNMKNYLGDQFMNNRMRDVETNQTLAYDLLTQNNPAYNFDWRTGNLTRTKSSILDVPSDRTDSVYDDFLKELQAAKTPDDFERLKLKRDILKQKNILPYLKGQQ